MIKISVNELANKPDELLDLVNENDEIIGEIIRKEANSNPKKIHREVAIIVVDNQGRVLLEKRSSHKKVNPSMWSLIEGHITKGTQILAAAHQELLEEVGFDSELTFIKKELHKYDWETHFVYYYLGKYNREEIIIETAEVEKTEFFSQEDFKKLISNGESINLKHLDVLNDYWKNNKTI